MTEGAPPIRGRQHRALLDSVVSAPVLLVACDYDGTVAPIVDDPELAFPVRESIVGLRSLASLPDTHVAVISGRSLRDLAALSRLPPEVHLVGSHGSEFEPGFAANLSPDVRERRDDIIEQLDRIAVRAPGALVERKPAGAAFHYRNVDGALADELIAAVLAGPGALSGVTVKRGKMVIELSAVATDKGAALERLRSLLGATAVAFIGDDLTDEDAFATLTGPDVGVKVGPGDSAAGLRVADTDAVARMLANLFEWRRSWLEGDAAPPIERHTLLSDQRTLALLTPDGRVTWLCHPRADSPAVFAELLGGPAAGSFSVRPDPERMPLGQRYAGNTMLVETRWAGLRVTDYLDASFGRPHDPPGASDLIRVLDGEGPVVIEFAPVLDFGRAPTTLEVRDDGVAVLGAHESVRLLASGVDWEIAEHGYHPKAVARVVLERNRPLVLELQLGLDGTASRGKPEHVRRDGTRHHWGEWAAALRLPSVTPDAVRRSALILKALCHQPSGAILAAATTSLPEVIGGVRNWDYRYCWPRDASVVADSLVRLGSTSEAIQFLDWLVTRSAGLHTIDALRPLYPLAGDEFLPEAVLPTLNGYRGSRPVRIGNLAEHQLQLDMFGPIMQLVHRLTTEGVVLADRHWQLVQAIVEAVARRWRDADHGIWEIRRAPEHHVHSRMMCWLALDRAVQIASAANRHAPEEWAKERDAVRDDILTYGWNDRIEAFSAVYGGDEVDAAVLAVATCGFLPPDDPRVAATVARIEQVLRRGAAVDRYHFDDGLPGREGGFLLCTAWLIEALVAIGRTDDARELYHRYVDLAGPTGLLTEQYEPTTETSLGNVPQAYSHAGLISAALALADADPTGRIRVEAPRVQ